MMINNLKNNLPNCRIIAITMPTHVGKFLNYTNASNIVISLGLSVLFWMCQDDKCWDCNLQICILTLKTKLRPLTRARAIACELAGTHANHDTRAVNCLCNPIFFLNKERQNNLKGGHSF